ncbi:MAG: CocE/NonD family hydrolase [Bacteroidetes bacterium]|nr:MAG: CocE/NonD family hydrolase [Bacteroidota bacterium]
MKKHLNLLCFCCISLVGRAQYTLADSAYVANNYQKVEKMIPMRDGLRLYTAIYLPKNNSQQHPIVLNRTPYSAGPYGTELRKFWNTNFGFYARLDYIIVFQDVRGRFMSEGQFVDVRPHIAEKTGNAYDEASDSYDTIDWLVKNTEHNNGNVGVFGISYPGFYSTMAALSGHPALKAVSPQAPVTDWFMGDDFHHNGAFMLMDGFNFYKGFGVPRSLPTPKYNPGFAITEPDLYKFYLEAGPIGGFSKRFLGDSIAFWNDLMTHPNYDNWWKARDARRSMFELKPAMLVVGGTFDAEDCFGAWNLYKAIESQNNAGTYNKIVMGPWFHGAWGGRSTGENLGKVKFGSKTSQWYQQNVEIPFFEQHLNKKTPKDSLAEATIFFTGENQWKTFAQWPPVTSSPQAYHLHPGGKLMPAHPKPLGYKVRPDSTATYTTYTSNPGQPVPYEGTDTIKNRTREYMAADQRFARQRNDVITFETEPLEQPLTLGGELIADLMVSINTTDADFVVKLIDVFPDNVAETTAGPDTVYAGDKQMNGYAMLVRGEVMRGKFRNSFENPEPFVPNKITKVNFALPDVAHTFQKGHRVMVQIQSSWFPLVDMNPQKFVDIYTANASDFQPCNIKVFHTEGVASKLILPVLK